MAEDGVVPVYFRLTKLTLASRFKMETKFFRKHLAGPRKQYRRTEHVTKRVEDDRTGMSNESFYRAMVDHLNFSLGVKPQRATLHEFYIALALTVRDRLVHRWINTVDASMDERSCKTIAYLSAEFLLGRQLENNLINAGCWEQASKALKTHDLDIYDLLEQEPEPGLGNGGLGRLAACFLDSLSTQEIPAIGYGIRYQYGIFKQQIVDGWQVERPDQWLLLGNPWEIARPERTVEVFFGGHTETRTDDEGRLRVFWHPAERVLGVPYDMMIPGYGTNVVNTVRLWSAQATEEFDVQLFNAGDFSQAVARKISSESITKVLYPNDETEIGRELRLKQQYFFVSCALQDMLRMSKGFKFHTRELDSYMAVQLNDTHPSIAVAELMRLLVDEELLPWEEAWELTRRVMAYTNHTLLPEALEKWPLSMLRNLLPRHAEIILEINHRFLQVVRHCYPHDPDLVRRMSIVEEGPEQSIRMAHLACVGSSAVNGVARLHTKLLKEKVLTDFYRLFPDKFCNITNGVTPRRWLLLANPKLSALIASRIGKNWITDLEQLSRLEGLSDDEGFCAKWRQVKEENKRDLAEYILQNNGIEVDPNSMFDVLVKRIHEYKRQLLKVLHVIALYNKIKYDPHADCVPRTVIFGGKAAPGYRMAKLIIKLINSVAEVINNDSAVSDTLKVVFLNNFNVSVGEIVYAAANLSEQISTAGKEASGTGNMKFSMNGALTVGTLDGANIEIREAVGEENFFLFGHTVEGLAELRQQGYRPRDYYEQNTSLRMVIDQIATGLFSRGDGSLFQPIVESLLEEDPYFLLADYEDYASAQDRIAAAYRDSSRWTRMSILASARSGRFSSDRSIREYCESIWHAKPIRVAI